MASRSRAGRGSRARGGAPAARAAAAARAPDAAVPGARFADLPAAELVGLLVRSNRRASDFVDAALVLAERERRLAAADEARAAAEEAGAEIRRLAAATEERLQAEIREWRRRAEEAEARLLRAQDVVPRPLKKRMLLTWESEGEAEAKWEEDRDALAIVPHGQVYEDLPEASFGAWNVGEERTRSEPNHGGDADMSVDGDDHGSDYYQVAPENDPLGHLGVGEDEIGGEPEGFGPEDPVALAVVAPGHELPPNDDDVVEAGEQELAEPEVTNKTAAAYYAQPDKPEAREKRRVMTATARPPIKRPMLYKMVFKALKEKERQATLDKLQATDSQPSLRCWLYAPLPAEPVAKEEEEEGPGDMEDDEDASQH